MMNRMSIYSHKKQIHAQFLFMRQSSMTAKSDARIISTRDDRREKLNHFVLVEAEKYTDICKSISYTV